VGSHWVDGKIGGGGSLDGGTTYVDCGDPAEFDFGSNDFTISTWAYRKTGFGSWDFGAVMKWNTGASLGTNEFQLMLGGSAISSDTYPNFGIESENTFYTTISPETTSNDTWYHLTGVRDGDYIRIFVNGVEKDSTYVGSVSINNVAGREFKFGSVDGGPGLFGFIDEVRVYNRALNADEIQRIYKMSQPKILAPTNTGLVGYWSFEEGTGTNVGDMSGNGRNGTFGAGMTESDWVDGKLGKALEFDGGSNDYVSVPNNGLGLTSWTISAWVYPYILGSDYYVIVVNSSNAQNYFFQIENQSEIEGGFYADGSWRYVTSSGADLQANTWQHVIFSFNNTTKNAKLYVNSEEKGSAQLNFTPTPDNTNNLWIGTDGVSYDYFPGKIDEVRIYDRALGANEIEALYKSGMAKINASQNNQLTDGLVGLWSFNGPDMDGNEAYDRSGQGNTGTLSGLPARAIGKVGQALDFNGSTDYVNVGSDNSLEAPTTTVAIWIKRDATGVRQFIFSDNIDSGSGRDHYLMIEVGSDDKLHVWFGDGTDEVHKLSTATIDTSFHHIGFIRDDTAETIQFIIDGIVESPQSYSVGTLITLGANSMWIGKINPGDGYHFDGIIDEVRMYNRTLSVQEVQRLYNLGR